MKIEFMILVGQQEDICR